MVEDNQTVINIIYGAVSGVIGWVVNLIWGSIRDLQKENRELQKENRELNTAILGVERDYAKRDYIEKKFDLLFEKLDCIRDRLDQKADK